MHALDSLDSVGGPAVIRSHAAKCIQYLANLSLFVHFGGTERDNMPGTSRLTVITMHHTMIHNVWVTNLRVYAHTHTPPNNHWIQINGS